MESPLALEVQSLERMSLHPTTLAATHTVPAEQEATVEEACTVLRLAATVDPEVEAVVEAEVVLRRPSSTERRCRKDPTQAVIVARC